MFQIIIALFAGICAGTITGLIPGLHINLVSLFVVAMIGYLLGFVFPIILAVFIIAMAVTHTFLDIIPAVFLGAPDSDVALGVLPGHKLMMRGLAYQAVKLTVIGSLFSLLICIALAPLLIPLIPAAYKTVKNWIGWILLAVVIWMILREKTPNNKFWSAIVFMLSGTLGLIVFNIPNIEQGIFAMLTGLFGISMLVISINQLIKIPEQKTDEKIKIKKTKIAKAVGIGTFSGSLVSFFPGIGPAQGAVIGSELIRSVKDYSFLIMLGGVNTVNMIVSFIILYTIRKPRNGAMLAVSQIIPINKDILIIFLISALIAGSVAAIIALLISKAFAKLISKLNYKLLCLAVIIFITSLAFLLSGPIGLLILAVATSIGIIPNILKIKRSHAMGCLLLPVILWFIL